MRIQQAAPNEAADNTLVMTIPHAKANQTGNLAKHLPCTSAQSHGQHAYNRSYGVPYNCAIKRFEAGVCTARATSNNVCTFCLSIPCPSCQEARD
jgi:hypothetical protein